MIVWQRDLERLWNGSGVPEGQLQPAVADVENRRSRVGGVQFHDSRHRTAEPASNRALRATASLDGVPHGCQKVAVLERCDDERRSVARGLQRDELVLVAGGDDDGDLRMLQMIPDGEMQAVVRAQVEVGD